MLGRRQFVEVAANFPEQCRYVLEMLGQLYGRDAEARDRGLTPDQRLRFHQEYSGTVMDQLHGWLEVQLAERQTEPNSGLGQSDHVPAAALASFDGVSSSNHVGPACPYSPARNIFGCFRAWPKTVKTAPRQTCVHLLPKAHASRRCLTAGFQPRRFTIS
jgi:hypothetical protein